MASYDNKHVFEIEVFDAGLNVKAQAINLTKGQSPDLKNVLFDDYGSVGLRPGIKTHNSSALATGVFTDYGVMGLASYKPATGSALLVAVANTSVWIATGVATAFAEVASAASVWTHDRYVEMVPFRDVLFFASEDYQPYKFNGTEYTRMGVSAPTQNITAVCDAAGTLTGEYQYVFWGVNSYAAEGDYGTPSTAVTLASGQALVSNIPTAPASYGIETWKVGRNTAGASGLFWYLTDVANGTTSFTDNVEDSALDTLAPVDQGYPRKFNFMIAYAGRMWGAVGDYLWFSNPNQPEEFPSENFILVGRGDGMDISSIAPFMGMIVISKSDYNGKLALYTFVIGDSATFSDPESWYLKLVSTASGSESQRGTIPFKNYLMLPNRFGIHLFDGFSINIAGSESSQGLIASEDIANPVSTRFVQGDVSGSPVSLQAAAAVNWRGRIWISHPYNTDQFWNTNTLQYDYQKVGGSGVKNGAWTEIPVYGASQWAIHEGRLFGGASRFGLGGGGSGALMSKGYVFEWDPGTLSPSGLDFGSQFAAHFVAAPIHGASGHEQLTKDFRRVIITEKGSTDISITVTFYVDGTSLSTATLIHTESYTLSSSGRDLDIRLPSVASGKRLWIKYAWTSPNTTLVTEASAPKLSRIKVIYNLRGLRNA